MRIPSYLVHITLSSLAVVAVMQLSPISTAWAVETHALQQTHTQTNETDTTLFSRSQWGLNEVEWQRYQTLMQGIRGSISPKSLSPLEVMGIHAETEPERKQYARRWAKMMREDVERTLAFQRAYTEAMQELYGKQPLFDDAILAALTANKAATGSPYNPNALSQGDRLLVFIKASACQACNVLAQQALSLSAVLGVQVDFYFLGTREPQDNPLIIAWAKQQPLEPARLTAKNVTLNHDKGTYLKVSGNVLADVPMAYLMRANKLQKWIP